MPNATIFPPMNPLKYVEKNGVRDNKYNTSHFRKQLFGDQPEPGEKKERWLQPVQHGQLMSTQLHTTGEIVFKLKKCDDPAFSQTITETRNDVVAGNLYYGQQLTTRLFRYVFPDNDGTYYHEVTVTYPTAAISVFISEPFEAKETWADTLLFEYSDSRNRYDTYFSQNPRFCMRFFGRLTYAGDVNSDAVFQDQGGQTTQLSNDRIRRFSLEIGPKRGGQWGNAEWVNDTLSELLRCDNKKLEGLKYSKEAGESIEPIRVPGNPLIRGTVELLEANRDATMTFGDNLVPLFSLPIDADDYPVAGSFLTLSGQGIFVINNGFVVDELADVPSLISDFNAQLVQYDFTGEFSFNPTTGLVSYNNTDEDGISGLGAPVNLYSLVMSMDVESVNSNDLLRMGYKATMFVVAWGDGQVSTIPSSLNFLATATHEYGATSTTMRIFHADNIFELQFNNDLNEAYVGGVDEVAVIPNTLQAFTVTKSNFPVLRLNPFLRAQLVLQKLVVRNSQLTDFNGNPWAPGRFPALSIHDFRNNALPVSEISAYVSGYTGCGTYGHSGQFLVNGQTPPATPFPGQTQGEFQAMQNAGYTVVTD